MTLFKRIVSVFFIAVLLITPTSAKVKSATSQSDTMLTDVLKDKNRDIIDDFFCLEKADDELKNYDLNNTPVLVVFRHALTNEYYEPLENAIAKVKDNSRVFFVLLQGEPVFLLGDKTKGEISIHNPYPTGEIPTYVRDVLSGTAIQTFQGQECNVQNVICHDGDRMHNGITLIYETDRGRFVRHYADTISDPIELTWDEFVKLQSGYRDYLHSLPKGYVGHATFQTYANNPDKYKPRMPLWQTLVIGSGIAVAAAGIIFVCVLLRKRYLRRKYDAFDVEV